MTQGFDDFARKHAEERKNRERLAKETKPEWEVLKGLVSQFELDGKGIDGYQFEWVRPLLVLNCVSAILFDGGDRNGVPQGCRVRFSRRPPGSGRAFPDESPVAEKTWSFGPEILNGEFVWFVHELGRRLSSAELSEEIAKQLARYHIEYEKAYGRAS